MPSTDPEALSRLGMEVIQTLLNSDGPMYGQQLMERLNRKSGSLYTLLDRLCRQGWLSMEEEVGDPIELRRPLRHFYRLTSPGRIAAKDLNRVDINKHVRDEVLSAEEAVKAVNAGMVWEMRLVGQDHLTRC